MDFREELYQLFRDTIISADTPNYIGEFNDIVEAIIEVNKPRKLYRFRACNTLNLDAILRNKCYASAPSTFNDPFDSHLPTDISDLEELHHNIYDVTWMRESIEQTGELPEFHRNLWSKEVQNIVKAKLMRINTKFYPDLQKITTSKAEQQIEMLHKDSALVMNFVQNHAYVACLSEDINSILMWSHYADYHKGFALEYDFDANQTNEVQSGDLFPVLYSTEPYNAKEIIAWFLLKKDGIEYPLPDINYWLKATLFKAKEWEYEKEWRILKKRNDDEPLYTSFDLIPSAIYYGNRITDTDFNLLHSISRQLGLIEYRMQPIKGLKEYKMVPELLKYNSGTC